MIRLSSGQPIQRDEDGNNIFGNSKVHTILLLLLFCRHEDEAHPGELSSPWRDRPEVRAGRKTKGDYVREVYEGIDLVPPNILQLVVEEMLDSGREMKPSLHEIQTSCRVAMKVQQELSELQE